VPTGTFTSMFDEPSSGSNRRQYLPHLNGSGIWMIPGSSSDAMAHSRPPWSIALTMISLARMSSFCCTSPCTFSVSDEPRMSARPALRTLLAIIFAASARS